MISLKITGATILIAALAAAQTPTYTVTDLGPAGTPFSQASFVNNNGFVSGSTTVASGASHSMMWYEGISGDIGGLGGPNSGAGIVNNFGEVVGGAETTTKDPNNENFCGYGTGLQCLTYIWQNGVMTALPTLGGTNASWGSINNRGEVAGYAETATRDPGCLPTPAPNGTGPQVLQYKPVIWGPEPGQIRELPLPQGDTVGVALYINDNGAVVGMTGTCANTVIPPFSAAPHAVLWENGIVTDLGNLGGTSNLAALAVGNAAIAINNRGQVVGVSAIPGSKHGHAFLWTWETGIQDLGTLPGDVMSAGLGINSRGEIIGNSISDPGPPQGNPRPFLWKDGKMYDLTALVPADAPLHILTASSINDRGQISGFGVTNDGNIHAYLLTPAKKSTPVTTAIVTPSIVTTSDSSVVLDGGASISAAGSLQYLFAVAPGGKQPALLQTATDPQATVEFVNGPGLYLVQLTVTDAAGTKATSPVVMLNYQP